MEGGALGEVLTAEEQVVLVEHMAGEEVLSSRDHWLGLSDLEKEGEWVWVSGEEVVYSAWAPGQPDDFQGEDCGVLLGAVGDWNPALWSDQPCTAPHHPICEKGEPATPSTPRGLGWSGQTLHPGVPAPAWLHQQPAALGRLFKHFPGL